LALLTGMREPDADKNWQLKGGVMAPVIHAPESREAASRSLAQPAIEVSGLRKSYGSTLAVKDVSFEVGDGEIFGILGPNGAGKTTTVECISGLRKPDSGTISVLGLDPQRDRAALRERVGVQLQKGTLRPQLTVAETVNLFASFYPQPADTEELIEMLGLGPSGTPITGGCRAGRSNGSRSRSRWSATRNARLCA